MRINLISLGGIPRNGIDDKVVGISGNGKITKVIEISDN